MIVVTAKVNPDVDGLACAVAYAEFLGASGVEAQTVISGTPDAEARFVQNLVGASVQAVPPPTFSSVVLVDASALEGLPAYVDPARVAEVIDHRFPHEAHRLFPNAKVAIDPVGAAATLVFERFERARLAPSGAAAMLLQAAIESNTQRLRGSVTTRRDVDAMGRLRLVRRLPPGAIDGQFQARRDEIVADLAGAIVREAKTFDDSDGAFVISQLEGPGMLDLAEACAGLTASLGRRVLLNLVDPVLPRSIAVVFDRDFRKWIERRAGLLFQGATSTQADVLLRKQLVARIRSST